MQGLVCCSDAEENKREQWTGTTGLSMGSQTLEVLLFGKPAIHVPTPPVFIFFVLPDRRQAQTPHTVYNPSPWRDPNRNCPALLGTQQTHPPASSTTNPKLPCDLARAAAPGQSNRQGGSVCDPKLNLEFSTHTLWQVTESLPLLGEEPEHTKAAEQVVAGLREEFVPMEQAVSKALDVEQERRLGVAVAAVGEMDVTAMLGKVEVSLVGC